MSDSFRQGSLTPMRTVAGLLFLFGPDRPGSDSEAKPSIVSPVRLPPGNYLLRAYVDRKGRLTADPTMMLGDAEFVGQVAIRARWGEGFPQAEIILGHHLK